MRRRRYRKPVAPTQNLDSFLDILTNTVGVLMFIGLFVSLLNVETDTIVRTPLLSETKKIPHFFELRDNEVIYLDKETVDDKLQNFNESLATCNQPEAPSTVNRLLYEYYIDQLKAYRTCVNQQAQSLRNFRATTGHYKVFFNSSGLVFQAKENAPGESIKELTENTSDFRSILETLNPETDYLAFLVRPDSFSAFRQARGIAWQENFDVGWEPMLTDTVIVFGSGGREIGVQ
ncbi:hypothetical protein [Lyngbya aestuarii]|uniref:hypothetical protein n=1 Tax=Lyngbya aestuarii TaxID=118322 RepID=UPI00403D8F72